MAKRNGGFPALARHVLGAAVIAIVILLVPHLAVADATLGQASGGGYCSYVGGADTIQTGSSTTVYSLPGAGAIDSWTVLGASPGTFPTDPILRFELWQPVNTGGYTMVGISGDQTVPQDSAPHTFPVSPIQGRAGDLLGLWQSGYSSCGEFTFGDWSNVITFAYDSTPDTPPAAPTWMNKSGWMLDLAAHFVPGPSFTVPKTISQCFNGGWKQLADSTGKPFKNQGDCVSFVSSAGKNTASG